MADLSPFAQLVLGHAGHIFRTAQERGPLTTVSERLDAWTLENGELFYESDQLEEFLRREARQAPPLFVLRDLGLMLYDMSLGEDSAEPEPPGLDQAAWVFDLALRTNPRTAAIFEKKGEPFPGLEPVSVDELEGLEIPNALLVALQIPWLFPVVANGRGTPLVLNLARAWTAPIEGSHRAHRQLWSLRNEGVYCLPDANTLVDELLKVSMSFNGKGGRLTVIHFNDPRSVEALAHAKALVKKPVSTPLTVRLVERLRKETPKRYEIREREEVLISLDALGCDHSGESGMGRFLIDAGFACIGVPDADPNDYPRELINDLFKGIRERDAALSPQPGPLIYGKNNGEFFPMNGKK